MKIILQIFIAVLIMVVLACSTNPIVVDIKPDNVASTVQANATQTSVSQAASNQAIQKAPCNLIAYQDTLFFLENQNNDLKIKPLVARKGRYGAYPEGIEINESNGEINISKSESGLRYKVFFVPDKTIDTCFTHLTISGVDYQSKIYFLDKNDKIAPPIYNNNPLQAIPGVNSGKTEFDDGDDDDNGNGSADEPLSGQEVIPQGLDISKIDGKIKLDNSLRKGFLGTNPKNGATKKVKLYYRLDDKSGKALNKIELEFYYYEKESDIPKSLKDKILQNQSGNKSLRSIDELFFLLRKPRPPQIVIVGRYL